MASKTNKKEKEMNWKEDVTLVFDDHTVKVVVKGDYYTDELADLFQGALVAAEVDHKQVSKVVFAYVNSERVVTLVTKE